MAKFIQNIDGRHGKGGADSARIFMAASSEQEERKKTKGGDEPDAADSSEGSQKLAKKGEDIKEEMDSLLDEIDAVLEENAEEFVKNYVQRGGE